MPPPVDIAQIALEARRLCSDLTQCQTDARGEPGLDLIGLCDDLQNALAVLEAAGSRVTRPSTLPPHRAGAGAASGPPLADLGALGSECIDRLGPLSVLAGHLRRPHHARQGEALALPLACWVARRGGELTRPALVVNAAGALANSTMAADDLTVLYGLMSDVVDALSPEVAQDRGSTDPTRPWRVLLLNRAIVETRSHRPNLMEDAFTAVVEALPGDAPDFFREAMGQMESLNYPPQVRAVVQRHADVWCPGRTLH
jgi:hypothetical protein